MVKLTTNKQKVIHRLKIIRGQVTKLIEMVESDEKLVSVIHTSSSTQKALKKADSLLIEKHLKRSTLEQLRKGEVEGLGKDLLEIYKYR